MTAPSPVPRRINAPSWLDLRLVVGVVLVLGSVLFGAKIVSGANHTYGMLAVTRDLAAGTLLSSDDVKSVHVKLPDRGNGIYVSDAADVLGKQLNRALASNELLPAAALVSAGALTTVTVPFTADHAPALSPGQRVEIWLTTKACASLVLLADVTVQDVHAATGGSFSSSGGQNVVISVAPDLAGRVVAALAGEGATIRAGILTGPARVAANDALPGLERCPPAPGTS
ncbi:MAG: hypothetical protein DLM58_00245 [Pseudonocardiales bacterium]|nr:MAG: hypothetical protein DLM58_00245 [Pseudonocardiales bacterium]